MVGNLSTVFEKATERYLDQTTSSDEEIAVEFPEKELEEQVKNKKDSLPTTSRRPMLSARTDQKRVRSPSEDSRRSDSIDPHKIAKDKKVKAPKSSRGVKIKAKRSRSRSLSSGGRWSSSPPPSSGGEAAESEEEGRIKSKGSYCDRVLRS